MSRSAKQSLPVAAPSPASSQMGCAGLLARLYWILAGDVALVGAAAYLTQRPGFSAADALFWAIAASLVGVRYLDITRLNGLTSDSQPATLAHWRRYALLVVIVSALLWGAAHGLSRVLA